MFGVLFGDGVVVVVGDGVVAVEQKIYEMSRSR